MSHKFPGAMSNSEPSCQEQHHLRRGNAPPKGKRDMSAKSGARVPSTTAPRDPGPKGDFAAAVRMMPAYGLAADSDSPIFAIKTKAKSQISPPGKNMLHAWANEPPPTTNSEQETWGHILRTQSSNENLSGFSKFDPLRTIHFLGKELQAQLQNNIPYNATIFNVIAEMQSALKRIPQDIQIIADTAVKKQCRMQMKEKNAKDECSQTPNMWYLEPVRLQQHLEESSEKIEKACQQMEVLCSKLKIEKESLEVQLQQERETSSLVKHQFEEYKVQLQRSNVVIDSLRSQNRELKLEIEKQKMQLAANDTPSVMEFKMFLKDLQTEKEAAEEENANLKHQIQVMHLETQKYDVLLQARDMQVKEIREEMTQLQEIVNEQLIAFQNLCPSDEGICDPSSHQTIRSNHSKNFDAVTKSLVLRVDDKLCGKATMTSLHSEPVQELFNNRFNQYDVQSAGGSTSASTDNEQHLGEMLDLNVQASTLKLRHVYKMPVSVAVGVTGSCTRRDAFYSSCQL